MSSDHRDDRDDHVTNGCDHGFSEFAIRFFNTATVSCHSRVDHGNCCDDVLYENDKDHGICVLDPSLIIALPCQSVLLLNFAQIVRFVKVVTWISLSC